MKEKISLIQKTLQEQDLDGWLLYDFQKRNPLAIQFLDIPSDQHLTRRLFYWIPAQGEPAKIVHKIESAVLDHLPGMTKVYLEHEVLFSHLQSVLKGKRKICMEYSPQNRIPAISYVDGGTIDVVKTWVKEVVSSGGIIQPFTCQLTDSQRKMQKEAAKVLEDTVDLTWDLLRRSFAQDKKITEYDVQQFMMQEIEFKGCISEGRPICACGPNSSNPHYGVDATQHSLIRKGDLILIDLWCKKKEEGAVYADISRMAVADKKATVRQQEIFSVVREAQEKALVFLQERCRAKQETKGYEMDQIARCSIEEAGYGKYFIHRTGHNIYTQDHGPGTHLDSLETWDDRPLILGSSFSIEPGVYLPGEFGVRLEYDVYLSPEWEVEVIGGTQPDLILLDF